jgi:hypothetical protein
VLVDRTVTRSAQLKNFIPPVKAPTPARAVEARQRSSSSGVDAPTVITSSGFRREKLAGAGKNVKRSRYLDVGTARCRNQTLVESASPNRDVECGRALRRFIHRCELLLMAAHWEHKLQTYKVGGIKGVDYAQIEKDLNDLGRDGWEARSTIAPGRGQGQACEVAVLLKRPGST